MGGFISIILLFSSNISLAFSLMDVQIFRNSLTDIVNKSQNLTRSYNDKDRILQNTERSNNSRIELIDLFLPKFESLLKNATSIDYPPDLKYVHDALVNSLKSETDSYKHDRNYFVSGNKTEAFIASDLFNNASRYELIYAKFLASQ